MHGASVDVVFLVLTRMLCEFQVGDSGLCSIRQAMA